MATALLPLMCPIDAEAASPTESVAPVPTDLATGLTRTYRVVA